MRRNIFLLCISLMLLSFSACKEENLNRCGQNETAATLKNLTGFDGCGWVLTLSDESRLEPTNLSDFDITLKDGKAVCITYEEVNAASICMVGPIVKLLSIE